MCLKCIGQTDRHSNYRKIILTEKSRPKIWGIGVGLGGHWLRRARKISHENGQTCGQIAAAGGSFPPNLKYAQKCFPVFFRCVEAFQMHARGSIPSRKAIFDAFLHAYTQTHTHARAITCCTTQETTIYGTR
jgi:hypothetical protein